MSTRASYSQEVHSHKGSSLSTGAIEHRTHKGPASRAGKRRQRNKGAAPTGRAGAGLRNVAADPEKLSEDARQMAAISRMKAIVELTRDGTILHANENFLKMLGYSLHEVLRRHHSMFVDETYRQSCEYREIWETLNRGESPSVPGKHIRKDGGEIWVRATFFPILDARGRLVRIAEHATDITALKMAEADNAGRTAALRKSLAVIEFNMDGTILDANQNFLSAFGYGLEEIKGRHHSIFVDASCRDSAEYCEFWLKLNRGEYQAAEEKRIGKGGREVWIQACYNPILDLNGKPCKVVNYVTDITAQKLALEAMIADTLRLCQAAVEGRLATRADASRHEGDYRKIVQGMNDTLDAVIGPLTVAADYVEKIARGYIPARIADSYNGEFNTIKNNLNTCIDAVTALVRDVSVLSNAAMQGKLATRADGSKHHGDYRKIVEGINQTLETVVEPLKITAQNAGALASSSEELTAVSQQMAGNAEETATQANVVSAASEQVAANVSSVATAAEQMQSSIREIAKNSTESARVARNAVSVAQSTNETVKKLGESSQEIGNVIKVITSIAQQTNLLALNATIEAARAGEAGKGFAVVANEVKELAKQTAKATEEISKKIEAIQTDTKGAVAAIEEIGTIITEINDISNSIATAVEEQTVTTNEIGRSVTEAARGVSEIARNIGGVAIAAKNTTQGANDTQKAARELSRMAAQLQNAISNSPFEILLESCCSRESIDEECACRS